MTNIQSGFGAVVRGQARLGEKVAFADTERTVTFVQFDERVAKLVDSLHQMGLRHGDRIAILSRNCIGVVECIAAARAGFIPVPLNWRLPPGELLNLMRDCAPAALVCDAHWSEVADTEILPHIAVATRVVFGPARTGWQCFEEVVERGNSSANYPDAHGSDTAVLIYTSGTTGTPKAAMISHKGLVANGLIAGQEATGVTAEDTVLCVMPLFHVGGLCYYLLPSYMAGATTILRPLFEINDLVKSLDRFKVSNVHLVPTMISDLVNHRDAPKAAAGLKRIVYAGSAMPVALLERAMDVFSGCAFSQSYGSTEGGIVTTLGPEDHRLAGTSPAMAHLLQSCGRPLTGTDLRIVDSDGVDCEATQPGEVLVRSKRTMTGYWNLPAKTEACFTESYLRTGDIGYQDTEGFLYLVDRKNDMIVTGGENVFPSEVEQVLYRSPDVAEAAVFGIADPRWIEKVAVAVVLRPDSHATPESIIQFTKQHLASYKCPKTVYLIEEMPRTGAGKVSRKQLREMCEGISKAKDK
jgi:acyl-CoA synthetase (AMP-forming)/AMP-acid ligase II